VRRALAADGARELATGQLVMRIFELAEAQAA